MGERPLLERWSALAARRLPLYRRAHHTVAVDGLSPEAVARRIVDLVAAPRSAAARASGERFTEGERILSEDD